MSDTALIAGDRAVERALLRAGDLIAMAESLAFVLEELGAIDLPPAAPTDAAQLRAVASLYLASTLEAGGLIGAAEDLTRLARGGGLSRDLGGAEPLLEKFWADRGSRATDNERVALFTRLFGTPPGPSDMHAGENGEFEELLLNLCDAIIKEASAAGARQGAPVRVAAARLADNLGQVAGGMTLFLAREVLDTLKQSLAILNHPGVKAALMARTMWDAVGAIDVKLRRPRRATLLHLRRGRAGMAVIAWLAEVAGTLDGSAHLDIDPDSPVVDAAVEWLDETLELIEPPAAVAPGIAGRSAAAPAATAPAPDGLAQLGA